MELPNIEEKREKNPLVGAVDVGAVGADSDDEGFEDIFLFKLCHQRLLVFLLNDPTNL
jgi:hypothetical protein